VYHLLLGACCHHLQGVQAKKDVWLKLSNVQWKDGTGDYSGDTDTTKCVGGIGVHVCETNFMPHTCKCPHMPFHHWPHSDNNPTNSPSAV
jgi:hypothetical protein